MRESSTPPPGPETEGQVDQPNEPALAEPFAEPVARPSGEHRRVGSLHLTNREVAGRARKRVRRERTSDHRALLRAAREDHDPSAVEGGTHALGDAGGDRIDVGTLVWNRPAGFSKVSSDGSSSQILLIVAQTTKKRKRLVQNDIGKTINDHVSQN